VPAVTNVQDSPLEADVKTSSKMKKTPFLKKLNKSKYLLLLLSPCMIYYLLFQYAPMFQGEAITKHRDEEIAKFILGKRNLSEWDQYVKKMKNLGLDQM
jgi:ABC-type polysaccharide transport system permease subunit